MKFPSVNYLSDERIQESVTFLDNLENMLSFPFEEEKISKNGLQMDYLQHDLFSSLKNLIVPPNVEYTKEGAIKLGKINHLSRNELITPSDEMKKRFLYQQARLDIENKVVTSVITSEEEENEKLVRDFERENTPKRSILNIVEIDKSLKKPKEIKKSTKSNFDVRSTLTEAICH